MYGALFAECRIYFAKAFSWAGVSDTCLTLLVPVPKCSFPSPGGGWGALTSVKGPGPRVVIRFSAAPFLDMGKFASPSPSTESVSCQILTICRHSWLEAVKSHARAVVLDDLASSAPVLALAVESELVISGPPPCCSLARPAQIHPRFPRAPFTPRSPPESDRTRNHPPGERIHRRP